MKNKPRREKMKRKLNFFWINPYVTWETKSSFFGFYKFDKCPCGCTKYPGWGVCLGLFGFNIQRE